MTSTCRLSWGRVAAFIALGALIACEGAGGTSVSTGGANPFDGVIGDAVEGATGETPLACKKDKDCPAGSTCLDTEWGKYCIPEGGQLCVPTVEVCDGLDNDCDGAVDNGPLCEDGDACNGAEACTQGVCQAGTPPSCDDGSPCTTDLCDAAAGCQHLPVAGPVSCDDGDACTGCIVPPGIETVYVARKSAPCPEAQWVGCNALWMPGFYDGKEKHVVRFDLEDGARLDRYTDGTAHLSGVAFPYHLGDGPGQLGEKWNLSIWFQYRGQGPAGEGTGGPKMDEGWVVPKATTDTWLYFDMIEGKATLQKVGSTDHVVMTQKPKGGVFPFQVGIGANDKTLAFGSSAWFDFDHFHGGGTIHSHGDVNVDLDPTPIPFDCDVCAGGQCQQGGAKTCDDYNACTADECDAATGECHHDSLEAAPCDDGEECTEGDACHAGKCKHGNSNDAKCHDGDPCTKDQCTAGVGCMYEGADPKTPCDDGDACTAGETCHGKKCKGGEALDCDDSEACTQDACDPAAGCSHTALTGAACDDGNACTNAEACANGACAGGQAIACDDSNPCTDDACDAKKGCTFAKLDGKVCDDGNACTSGDACKAGKCKAGDPLDCDDGNPCTVNACDWAEGCLSNAIDGKACDDGTACTEDDACQAGKCLPGKVISCDDGNPCTKDSCHAAFGCAHQALNAIACDDGSLCTFGDVCAFGSCKPGEALDCNDQNPCTSDVCQAEVGCVQKPLNGKACSDGNVCTEGDACQAGACQAGPALTCDDGNPCSEDSCHKATGCVQKALTGPACDDGSACTAGDACKLGTCGAGTPVACDDGKFCTSDACDPKVGCTFVNKTAVCDDGDVCTTGDACKGGQCLGKAPLDCQDGNPCTIDTCDAKGCLHKSGDGLPCEDGSACTQGDACLGGSCKSGKVLDCDDGNPCTADGCNPALGCKHANADGAGCSDGNPCTAVDLCAAGKCLGKAAGACDDANPCTKDTCSPDQGCAHANADGAACSDGSACTAGDACLAGKCSGAQAVVCHDGNPCTLDGCDVAKGCVFANADGVACDDGSACSEADACLNGKCAGGKAKSCNDGNPCTQDGCDPKAGCKAANLDGAICVDGNPCTLVDACVAGQCVGKGAPDCNDGNPCTEDGCSSASGCTHVPLGSGSASLTIVSDPKTLANGKPGVPTWNGHKSWTAQVPGATWIWTEYLVSDPVGETFASFERTFEVPAGASGIAATLVIAADNGYECTLNGLPAGKDATEFNYFESGKDTWSLGSLVKPGTNVFACKVRNWPMWYGTPYANPAGLLYKLSLAFSTVVACEDGNACTQGDVCVAGQCKPGAAKTCADSNACTADTCNPANGLCVFAPANGAACNDGNGCTGMCLQPGVLKSYQATHADSLPPAGQYGGGHAITIPGFFDGNGGHAIRFHFDADARLDILASGDGRLHGHATVYATGGAAGVGEKWLVDVMLKYRGKGPAGQGSGGPKLELKPGYQTKTLTNTWLYFDIVPTQATLKKVGSPDHAVITQAPAGSMYPFQVGKGANGKNLNFGASSWFFYTRYHGGKVYKGSGDFNLDLTWLQPATTCDVCQAGQCGGAPVTCDDGDPCTTDSCSAQTGTCSHVKVPGCCG